MKSFQRGEIRGLSVLLLAVLALGFTARLWTASTTDNADARTLTWGSAWLATGSGDPYRKVVAYSIGDPIPLNSTRSLSLAQGYVGVLAGAVPLYVGEQLGLIHLGDEPNGRTIQVGEILAYKLSYLIPEIAILWSIFKLLPNRRRRNLALGAWATTPLLFYTWGQGMPDAWTIAAMLLTVHLFRRCEAATSSQSAGRYYLGAGALVSAGAWGTKLIPIILMLPLITLLARDRRIDRKRKWTLGAGIFASFIVLGLPYLLDPFMRMNVLVRFEFDMLFEGPGIPTASGILPAQIGLALLIASTVWFVSVSNPWPHVERWLITTMLIMTSMSGIITHLMVWALVAIVLLFRNEERAAVGVHIGMGLITTWHLISYGWLAGVFAFALDRELVLDQNPTILRSHIPGYEVLGGVVSSLMFASVAYALFRIWWPVIGSTPGAKVAPRQVDLTLVRRSSLAGLALYVVALPVASLVVVAEGNAVWDLGYAAFPSSQPLFLDRGESYETDTITSTSSASSVKLRVDRATQPSLDELRISILKGTTVLATAASPIWVAEPKSEAATLTLGLDKSVELFGTRLRVERVADQSADQQREKSYFAIEAVKSNDSELRPNLQLMSSEFTSYRAALPNHLLNPWRILGVPVAAALLAWVIARRLADSNLPAVDPFSELMTPHTPEQLEEVST